MTRKIWLAAAGAATLWAIPAEAQQTDEAALAALDAQLPGTLINDPTRLDWERQGENLAVESLTDPAIPGGGAATRYTVRRAGPQPYSAQASVPLTQEIRKGDTVTVGFWARTERAESGDGQGKLGLRVQLNQDPWPGFADTTLAIGPEWDWHEVSATATTDMRRGSGILAFHLAGARQTIDIGQAIVVKGAAAIAPTERAAPQAAATAELPEPLRGAGRLVNNPVQRGWRNAGPAGASQDRAEPAVWLGQATRYTSAVADSGTVTTTIPLGTAVAAGAKYLIAVVARTESAATDDGKALVGIRVQDSEPPHSALINAAFKVGPNWQLVRVPVTATADLPAERAEIVLDFARAAQAVDIGPVYVLKVE
jgi:hypothetical protein